MLVSVLLISPSQCLNVRCRKKLSDHPVALVADVTTCRHHMELHHKVCPTLFCVLVPSWFLSSSLQGEYLNWADKNQFQSMLPKDAQRRHDAATAYEQTHLDSHLKELLLKERAILYTDGLFCNDMMEWLVSMDQVSSLYHDRFAAHYEHNFSQFRHLSTPHFKRWSILLPMQPAVSRFPITIKPDKQLLTHLGSSWQQYRNNWQCITYSCSKNCPNVWLFLKDWVGLNQINYQIICK